jgi:rfaE bifunctional protein nucleotidyltransferase chain/domain
VQVDLYFIILIMKKISSKIISVSKLKSLRKRGKLVFTNGCFDILHKGHVTYLEKAKALGDSLVIAVNSDASVRSLKGPQRPINTLKDRMAVLAALASVDWVVSFNDKTPLKVVTQLRPDVLVKGGDWKVHEIVGSKEVLSWGGKVKSLPFVEGKSTTRIIEKARENS